MNNHLHSNNGFGCPRIYMGFANILSDTIDMGESDSDNINTNTDLFYIEKEIHM
ncbi:MAG: hypothetical protein QS721_06105 [Candidatus Endonucleobacter sp. (ex Gigantidas childressi)]|nr:hypothetical protein [Candidatus Endonucleobacter sp. (ex Gigantidas childressi)]